MSEQAPTPDEVADRSGKLFERHNGLVEIVEKSDHEATQLADRVTQKTDALMSNETPPDNRAHSAREIELDAQHLNTSATAAYLWKANLNRVDKEGKQLLRDYPGELHTAATASAHMQGVDIVDVNSVPTQSTSLPDEKS